MWKASEIQNLWGCMKLIEPCTWVLALEEAVLFDYLNLKE
jgi:hypothetical protein